MTKVIFLDIDGVLNTPEYQKKQFKKWKKGTSKTRDEFGYLFCPEAVNNLEYLVHVTGAKVVVSSSWRIKGLDYLRQMFKHRNILVEIIDVTPELNSVDRGVEIQEWLTNEQIERYVILDDDTDFLPEQQRYFVNTPDKDGFNWKCMVKAIKILMDR